MGQRSAECEALGKINRYQDRLSEGPLDPRELTELLGIIRRLHHTWEKPQGDTAVEAGVGVILNHFVRALSIDSALTPQKQYREVLKRTLPTGYFRDTDAANPELLAISTLVAHHTHTRKRKGVEIDFSGLVTQPK